VRFKDYFKRIGNENRFIAPIYYRLTMPFFTKKFLTQVMNNRIFDVDDQESMLWKKRIEDVLVCPDNKHIVRVKDAGRILSQRLIMHNGIMVHPLSYYNKYVLKMLIDNKGVHEPQEEKAFQEVLKYIPENGLMIELGSYWSFYSLWFNKAIKGAKNFMVEPNPICLQSGKSNFRINKMEGTFINGFIGREYKKAGIPTFSLDFLVKKYNITHIHILHADIQGSELEMLFGSKRAIDNGLISYFFISTHSDDLHCKCIDFLIGNKFDIISSATCSQSYSVDGLIVAKAHFISEPGSIDISLR
jgi:hypothetical protein